MKQLEEVKKQADIMSHMSQFGDERFDPFAEYKPVDMKKDKGRKAKDKTDGQPDPDEVVIKLYGDIKRS